MANKKARNYTNPELANMSEYHCGEYKRLKCFNSDRPVYMTDRYTVSEENTASTLRIVKVGQRMSQIGLEVETASPLNPIGSRDPIKRKLIANVLDLAIMKAGFPDDFFKIEADCTVSAECITQTFTKGWLRNNYKCFKALYECFEGLTITTNNEACGMHVNLDLANFGKDFDTQVKNVRKLGYLINKNYDFFKVALYRQGSTRWCPRMNGTKEYWKNTDLYSFPIDHSSCCVNMGHIRQNRVEIRLVGGQKNYACFRNTMETVFQMIDAVKRLSWDDLDDLTKVFKGCNYHVFDRINSNCLRQGVISQADVDAIRATANLDERYL